MKKHDEIDLLPEWARKAKIRKFLIKILGTAAVVFLLLFAVIFLL